MMHPRLGSRLMNDSCFPSGRFSIVLYNFIIISPFSFLVMKAKFAHTLIIAYVIRTRQDTTIKIFKINLLV